MEMFMLFKRIQGINSGMYMNQNMGLGVNVLNMGMGMGMGMGYDNGWGNY